MACGHLSLSLGGLPAPCPLWTPEVPGPAGWPGEGSSLTSTGISWLSQPGAHLPGEGSRGPGGEGDWAQATHPFQAASVPVLLTPCSDPLELILGPGRGVGEEGKKGKTAGLLLPAGLLTIATAVQGEPRHYPPPWPSLLAPEWQSSRRVKMADGSGQAIRKTAPCGAPLGVGVRQECRAGVAHGSSCRNSLLQGSISAGTFLGAKKERVSSANPSHCIFGQASSLNAPQEATLTGSSQTLPEVPVASPLSRGLGWLRHQSQDSALWSRFIPGFGQTLAKATAGSF